MPPHHPDIEELILSLAGREHDSEEPNRYQVNVRLDRQSAIDLEALARVLGQSKSAMATKLLKSAIQSGYKFLPDDLDGQFSYYSDQIEAEYASEGA